MDCELSSTLRSYRSAHPVQNAGKQQHILGWIAQHIVQLIRKHPKLRRLVVLRYIDDYWDIRQRRVRSHPAFDICRDSIRQNLRRQNHFGPCASRQRRKFGNNLALPDKTPDRSQLEIEHFAIGRNTVEDEYCALHRRGRSPLDCMCC